MFKNAAVDVDGDGKEEKRSCAVNLILLRKVY